jgi:hypothetical protein
MAVTQKIDYVLEKIREENLSYISVFDGATLLHKIECESADESIVRLEEFLSSVEGGGYATLKLSDKSGKDISKGGKINAFQMRVKLGGGSVVVGSGGVDSVSNGVIAQMQKNFDLQIKHMEERAVLQKQIDELANKISEKGKKDKPDLMETALNGLLPLFVQSVAGGSGAVNGKAAVNGPVSFAPGTPALADDVSADVTPGERLKDALNRWKLADADFLNVIERVVLLAETDKPKYNLAKGML